MPSAEEVPFKENFRKYLISMTIKSMTMFGAIKKPNSDDLTPEHILDAIDRLGFTTTGRCLPLNSMENRVYEVEIETDSNVASEHFLIAKFYRSARWTKEQILEEHGLFDLQAQEIPCIAPLRNCRTKPVF
ncbi:MAG: hypothetical protein R3A45_03215 [Bdellovibrionota bacterium]